MPRATGSVSQEINAVSRKTELRLPGDPVRLLGIGARLRRNGFRLPGDPVRLPGDKARLPGQGLRLPVHGLRLPERGALPWVMGSAWRPSGPAPPIHAAKPLYQPG